MTMIADGADEVLKRSREQLRNGATQIKLMAGGGVSQTRPPRSRRHAVPRHRIRRRRGAPDNWGTYVTVHAYTPKAIRAAVEAGVKCLGRRPAHRRGHREVPR